MKTRIIATLILLTATITAPTFAQTPREFIKANLANISLPTQSIKSFAMDLTINSGENSYPIQVRYEKEKIAFNCFDKDKTPIVVARNKNVLLNDALNTRVGLFQNNIFLINILYENNQLNANFNFHQPTKEEKENAIKIDFLSLAEQGHLNMNVAKEGQLTKITGQTSQNSFVTTFIKEKDFFPLKKMVISGEDFDVIFDNIKVNEPIEQSVYDYSENAVKNSGIQLEIFNTADNVFDGIQLVQMITTSIMIRAAFYNKELQNQINVQMGQPLDWAKLKAGDLIKSAKLRTIFKSF